MTPFYRWISPRRSVTSLAVVVFLATACGGDGGSDPAPRNAAACTDFYEFTNATWIASTPAPPAGQVVDNETGVVARNQVRLLEALARTDNTSGAPAAKAVLALYRSQQDRAAVEAAGLTPLAPSLALIDQAQTETLPLAMGQLLRRGVHLPVIVQVQSFTDDNADSAVSIDTLIMKLPDAESALVFGTKAPRRAAFEAQIVQVFALLGDDPTQAAAAAVSTMAMQTRLNELAIESIDKARSADATGGFDVNAMLASAGVPAALPRRVDDQASHVLNGLAAEFSVADWRHFLRWRLVLGSIDHLPARFAAGRPAAVGDESQEIKLPNGVVVDPRIELLASVLPQEFDRFVVATLLPSNAAVKVIEMTDAIRASLHARIDSRDWLNAASKAASHRSANTVEMVFPSLVPDPVADIGATPELHADALFANVQKAAETTFDRRIALAMKSATHRSLDGGAWWRYEPHYNPDTHQVTIQPVAVQIALSLDDGIAAQYGSLGTLIAHEMLHIFGTAGDLALTGKGRTDWLDAGDLPHLNAQLARLQANYSEFVKTNYGVSPPSPRVNGEDFSDLGMVVLALDALRRTHPDASATDLFANHARTVRTRQLASEDKDYAASVPAHGIYRYRAYAPLANLPAFAEAYGCGTGDPMVRTDAQRLDLF